MGFVVVDLQSTFREKGAQEFFNGSCLLNGGFAEQHCIIYELLVGLGFQPWVRGETFELLRSDFGFEQVANIFHHYCKQKGGEEIPIVDAS